MLFILCTSMTLIAGMLEVVRGLQRPLLARSCSSTEGLDEVGDISVVRFWRGRYPTHGASVHDVNQCTVDEMLP